MDFEWIGHLEKKPCVARDSALRGHKLEPEISTGYGCTAWAWPETFRYCFIAIPTEPSPELMDSLATLS